MYARVKKRNTLLISNTKDNAIRLLDPYKEAFEQNSLLKAYYGDMREIGSWAKDEFSLTNGAAFRALGAGESPRGTRKGEVRPDCILVDDFDTDEDCRNPDIVNKKWDWFEGAAFPTRSVRATFWWFSAVILLPLTAASKGQARKPTTGILSISGTKTAKAHGLIEIPKKG